MPVLIVIIIVLIIAFIIYAFKKEKGTDVVLNPNPITQQTATTTVVAKPVVTPAVPSAPATPAPSATTTSAWKTYTNRTKGYSVKYPPSFTIDATTDVACVNLVKNGVGYISIGVPASYDCNGFGPGINNVVTSKSVSANGTTYTASGFMDKDWKGGWMNFSIGGKVEVSYGVRTTVSTVTSSPQEYNARLAELEAVIATITLK